MNRPHILKSVDLARFCKFWVAYPNKTGKIAAQRVWLKLLPDDEFTDYILAAIERAKRTAQWRKDNGEYIPHPTTWLNQGRWDDHVDQEQENAIIEAHRAKAERKRMAKAKDADDVQEYRHIFARHRTETPIVSLSDVFLFEAEKYKKGN